MGAKRFVLNGMSYHGHGAINEIPGIIQSKGFKKAFVASDPDLVKFGVTAKVTDLLEKNGIVATVRRRLGSDVNAACGQLRRGKIQNNQPKEENL